MRPIALTSGDPAGIAPEITAKAWRAVKADVPFFVIGDAAHYAPFVPVSTISKPKDSLVVIGTALPILPHSYATKVIPGTPNPSNARFIIDSIKRAVTLVQQGHAAAICTNPIHKLSLYQGANFTYAGHTEYVSALVGGKAVMMLVCSELRVVPVTVHIPLNQVATVLSTERVEHALAVTLNALRYDFAIAEPRLVVAGLNPHAGEGGAFGHEDQNIIEPIVKKYQAQGIDIQGPLPADTLFHKAMRKMYDAAVCMYHDQALIPLKTLDFTGGVNVTLGLPIIRTSPDHGTAFSLVGQNCADATSLINALLLAAELARQRHKQNTVHADF